MAEAYDAVLIVSFGGPEGPDDVLPFLENVLRGRNVPRERMLAVAEHYQHFGGVSPLNEQNRQLALALQAELKQNGPELPVYFGNRNWHPMLPDTLGQMGRDGVRRALALVTSAYSSYSSCRQYLENIASAREAAGQQAPQVDKLRAFYNHPGFIGPMVDCVAAAIEKVPAWRRDAAQLVFTAHSIPLAMAATSQYAMQLDEAARLVCETLGRTDFQVCYQSRSGPPTQPWLEPDICDVLRERSAAGACDVIIVPIGFLSDHIEILWDLDTEARQLAGKLGINIVRSSTVGSHPNFVRMIRELILERTVAAPRRALGRFAVSHDQCPADCCVYSPAGRPK